MKNHPMHRMCVILISCTTYHDMSYGPGADLVLMKLITIFLYYMQCVYTCNTKTTPLAVFVSEYNFGLFRNRVYELFISLQPAKVIQWAKDLISGLAFLQSNQVRVTHVITLCVYVCSKLCTIFLLRSCTEI